MEHKGSSGFHSLLGQTELSSARLQSGIRSRILFLSRYYILLHSHRVTMNSLSLTTTVTSGHVDTGSKSLHVCVPGA